MTYLRKFRKAKEKLRLSPNTTGVTVKLGYEVDLFLASTAGCVDHITLGLEF